MSIPVQVHHESIHLFQTFMLLDSSSILQTQYISKTVGYFHSSKTSARIKPQTIRPKALTFVNEIITMYYGGEIKASEKDCLVILLLFTNDFVFFSSEK